MKLTDATPGTRLVADAGFTCLDAGQIVVVSAEDRKCPFVLCRDGKHYLDGQTDADGNIVAF